jgi:LDH2 family malate/lactate/ureidoglycolate dehydrogenase
MGTDLLVPVEPLHRFVERLFGKAGFQPDHAADAASVLMYASRRGVDTHGVRNLKPIYFRLLEQGMLNLQPTFRIEHETPVSARVDGDDGLGLAASCWAMRLAMDKAVESGMAFVSMRNSWHFGAAGYYPWMALEREMIGIGMTARFSPTGEGTVVVPTFSTLPMFSTNPLAIGFPTREEPPWLFDMATSTIPFNRITKMRDAKESIPLGWGIDEQGQPTTDPGLVRAIFPLGTTREMGSHKGYGLSMMVEVLCALLSGAWSAGPAAGMGANHGHRQRGDAHFFGAVRIDAFTPLGEFKDAMDAMIRSLHDAPVAEDQERIYVAGEIEHETEQERLRHGIPLPDTVVADIRELGQKFDVPLPF